MQSHLKKENIPLYARNFLRSVMILSPADLVRCVYLCLNKLAPAYEGIELGIGENILMKAIATATGRSVDKIKIDAQEKGFVIFRDQ